MGWGAGRGPCLPQEGGGMSARPEGEGAPGHPVQAVVHAPSSEKVMAWCTVMHTPSLTFAPRLLPTGPVFGTTWDHFRIKYLSRYYRVDRCFVTTVFSEWFLISIQNFYCVIGSRSDENDPMFLKVIKYRKY